MTEEQKKAHLNNLLFAVKKCVGTFEELDAIRQSFQAVTDELLKTEKDEKPIDDINSSVG